MLLAALSILCGVIWVVVVALFVARYSLMQFMGVFLAANTCVVLLLSRAKELKIAGLCGLCVIVAVVLLFHFDQLRAKTEASATPSQERTS